MQVREAACLQLYLKTLLGCLPIVLSILFYVRSVNLSDFLEFVCEVRTRQKLSRMNMLFCLLTGDVFIYWRHKNMKPCRLDVHSHIRGNCRGRSKLGPRQSAVMLRESCQIGQICIHLVSDLCSVLMHCVLCDTKTYSCRCRGGCPVHSSVKTTQQRWLSRPRSSSCTQT